MVFSKTNFSTIKKITVGNKEVKKLKKDALYRIPLLAEIENEIFPNKTPVSSQKVDNHLIVYSVNDKPILFSLPTQQICPHLMLVLQYPDLLPAVYVDEGAVKAVLKKDGATKLMAPGIKQAPQDFEVGDIVAVRLLEHEEAFAIGIAMQSSKDIRAHPKDCAIEIKHVLKDALWEARDKI